MNSQATDKVDKTLLPQGEALRRLVRLLLCALTGYAIALILSRFLLPSLHGEAIQALLFSTIFTLLVFGSAMVYGYWVAPNETIQFLGLSAPSFPKKICGIPIGYVLLIGLGFLCLLLWATAALNTYLIEQMGGALGDRLRNMSEVARKEQQLIFSDQSLAAVLLRFFALVLLAALCEELFMRGALQPILIGMVGNKHIGILLTALLFAILHMFPEHLLPIFVWAVAFGYLREYSGSIWPGIILHFCNNLLTVMMYQ